MANTVMTAKNTFAEGLIMDFAPDNTQATCMTSALNATLLTFNGNEMSLQNDMGNGRVETAYLPEGYVPLGTCEFGDIIYIVSYNPITNKSLIGCFPSPERNITTDEILDIGQKINYTDFLDSSLNGTIKNTAVKKVLIETKKLNPGDKYIIYTDLTNALSSNASLLSDWGAKKHNIDPRAIKLHVVSIEDTGKITYLDTTTKWYDDYYIKEGAVTVAGGKTDLDSYRNLVSSEWSIFTSKVSGKLAILAELETIDSFSCSYLLEKYEGEIKRGDIKYKKYKIKLLPSYQAKEGVLNPYIFITNCGFQIIDDEKQKNKLTVVYVTSEKNNKLAHIATNLTENLSKGWEWPDRNKFDAEILLEDGGEIYFEIPYKAIDTTTKTEYFINSESFVYNFTVVPSMGIPNGSGGWKMFGRLDHLKVDLTIDFNKVGTGDVDFYTWKYHNSDESSMLTYGINTYPEPNCEVKFIQMDFYDHLGHVAQYILDGRKSYNGTFNEYFSLGGLNSNFRISKYKIDESPVADPTEINNKKKRPTEWSDNPKIIEHFVEETTDVSGMAENFDYITTSDKEGNPIYLKNTAGTIYPGALYGVKILVWLGPIGSYAITLEWIKRKKVYHRWFWTNAMFNEYYYNTKDFDDLLFELILDSKALFETNSKKYIWNTKEIMNLSENFDNDQLYKTYSANVLYIGESMADDNIFMYIQGGLKNDYNCFNLINSLESKSYTGNGGLENIKAEILLGQAKINYTIKGDLYEFTGNSIAMTETTFLETTNIIKNDGKRADFKYLHNAINTEEIKNNGLKDDFNINFIGQTPDVITEENIDFQKITTDLSKCYYLNYEYKQSLPLNMSAIVFNKAYTQNIYSNNLNVPVYTPIISSTDDLFSLGISGIWETNDSVPSDKFKRYNDGSDYKGIKLGFNTAMSIGCCENQFMGTDFNLDGGTLTFTSAVVDDFNIYLKAERGINPASDSEYIDKIWGKFSERMNQFFLIYPGGWGGKPTQFAITDGSVSNYSNVNTWYSKNKGGSTSLNKPESVFITGGAYDITKGALFDDMHYGNRVGLLATKHKLGYTILNAALNDWWYGATVGTSDYYVNLGFSQTGMKHSSNGVFQTFENFAYHLYLILSRAFHKNKRIEDTSINLRNYVKNGNSEITFIKDIVVKLSSKDETKNDIALQKMSFKEYSNIICNMSIFNEATEDGKVLKNSKNIKLKFIESAINNELTINIKNLPLSIVNIDAEAYLLYNGLLIPTYNLANGLFYMYNSGKLQVYLNGHLSFDIKEVSDNLKYLFGGIIPKGIDIVNLRGVHPPKLETQTPAQIAYNKFVDEVRKVTTSTDFLAVLRIYEYLTELERIDIKNTLINQILAMMSTEYIDTYSKYDLSNMVKSQTYTGDDAELGKWNDLFSTWFINIDPITGSNIYSLELNIYQTLPYDNTYLPAEKYEFDCGLNLSSFNYENNTLALKDNGVYSMFGIRDYDLGNSAYVGLVRNIVIDQEFKIV